MYAFFFFMIRRPPRSTQSRSSAASDVYKRQGLQELRSVLGERAPLDQILDGEPFFWEFPDGDGGAFQGGGRHDGVHARPVGQAGIDLSLIHI